MVKPPFLIPSVIIVIISLPLVAGVVPRNRFYGVRTLKTLSNESVWYAANRFGGWLFIASGLIYLAIAAFVPYSPDSASLNWWVHMAGLLVPLGVSIFAIHRYTKRL